MLMLLQPMKNHVFKTIQETQMKMKYSIIEFSKDGSLFGIYNYKTKTVKVYDSNDINQCFEAIKRDEYLWKFTISEETFEKVERIIFDLRNKYIAMVSDSQIVIYELVKGNVSNEPFQRYTIDESYEKIFDCIIDSHKPTVKGSKFNCVIACKQDGGRRMIEIFDIADQHQ